ncbi:MAG: hypothetical protein IJI85_10255 [Clostridia bacterium]|nr:hypothetical protein [Clostridia bacterium]
MTGSEKEVIDRLARIESAIEDIKEALKRDYHLLHGNGRPGLEHRVGALELNWRWVKWLAGVIGAGVGFIASFLTKN